MEQSDILRNLRIEQLTPMQEAARDAYQSDKDLVLLSPTGSGKTLAFLLPLVQSLKADVQGVQAVVLVPSRELALQIENVFKSMNVPFKAMSCYGGRPAMDEHRTMKGINPAVIIGTPGRMNDHLRKQNFDTRFVTTLVIDEFDKCLEFGFHDEMAEVIGQLPALKKRVLLSATDAEEIPQFTGVGGGIVTAGCQAEFSFGRNRIRTIGLAEGNLSRKRQAGDAVPAALYAGRPFYTGIRELSRERGAYGILSEVEEIPLRCFSWRYGTGRPRAGAL